MKKPPAKPSGRAGGSLTSDEADLWHLATRSMQPVTGKPRIPPDRGPKEPVAARTASPREARPPAPVPPAAPAPKKSPVHKPPPIAEFDRRKVRHISSGRVEIDARLDLHGARQRDAHRQLRDFLLSCYARGLRTVLVITGKGSDTPVDPLAHAMGGRRRGIIRRSVPQWLDEPELRAVVVSYTTAGVRHGGEGALYVQLRKAARINSD